MGYFDIQSCADTRHDNFGLCSFELSIYWQYALTLGVLSIIVITVIVRTQIKIAPVSRQVAEKSSAMTAYFADVIGNISAVKAFAREKNELAAYKKYVDKWDSARNERNEKCYVYHELI